MIHFVPLSKYREHAYPPGARPDVRTLRRRIDNGELPGKLEGKRYYVRVDASGLEVRDLSTIRPVNRLAAGVLQRAMGG